MKRSQPRRGVTVFVVVVLLAVMLLGALALARMTEAGTLASGNTTYRETSLQASEIGLNAAFADLRALDPAKENDNDGTWYWAQAQPQDPTNGLPLVDFDAAPAIAVGPYTVNYVVERVCSVPNVTEPLRECLVKAVKVPSSAVDSDDKLDPPNVRQYRATVRVSGPKDTTVFIQSLLTKG